MAVGTYALVDSENRAQNYILWDGVSPYTVPEGYSLVPIPPEMQQYEIGWVFVVPPPEPNLG